MRRKKITIKIVSIGILIFCVCIFFHYSVYGAGVDVRYQPLLEKNSILYSGKWHYFSLSERGEHGNPAYGHFDASPRFSSLENLITYAPFSYLELNVGYEETLPSDYKISIYNPQGNVAEEQSYNINYFRDYYVGLRARSQTVELFADFLEKNQKARWNWSTMPNKPHYYSYIRSHYEDIRGGVRFLSKSDEEVADVSHLSQFITPLLKQNQINVEGELEYRNGNIRRNSYYDTFSRFDNFYHTLRPHVTPKITLRYGIHDEIELESGVAYTTPFKYAFTHHKPDGASLFTTGTYQLKDSWYIPFKMRYRPVDEFEFMVSSDFNFITQKLNYYTQVDTTNQTRYPYKELNAYRIKPTAKLTYLYRNEREKRQDAFLSVTKDLLLRNQFMVELLYQRDIVHLSKEENNGALNIIDPYNAFLYPLDSFVAGTEYATFLAGNGSHLAANVLPQNYDRFETTLSYGITDTINAGVKGGFNTGSAFSHFIVDDLSARFYKIDPYFYFDFGCDWQMTHNSLMSLKSHFVPRYTTIVDREGHSNLYKAENRYFNISLGLTFLF